MKTAIFCLVLAALAAFRAVTLLIENKDLTGELLGYEPMKTVSTIAIAVLAGFAGVYLIATRKR